MKFKFYIWLMCIGILSSCSDFLYQEPDEQVSISEQFSFEEGVLQAINGMYYSLEGFMSSKIYYYPDLQGGNLTFTPGKTDNLVEVYSALNIENVYNFQDLEDESEFASIYSEAYDIVNQANLILDHIDACDFLTEDQRSQITAEALVGRAYSHYFLTLLYAQNYNFTEDASHPGIIYNTGIIEGGKHFPSRNIMAETYQFMQNDLDQALSLFTSEQALSYGLAYSYFNKISTQALYARIALQMNDWEKARYFSDLVISDSGIELMDSSSYIAEWEKSEEAVTEIIFEFSAPRTSDEGLVSSSLAHEFFRYTNQDIYGELVASGDLLRLYSNDDIRAGMFLEALLPTNVNGIITLEPYYFSKKFQGDPGVPIIRLSEMYLIRSEANARLESNMAQALDDLNEIRVRAGLNALESDENILEEIFLERRKEFAFEGLLLYDIARYKKDIIRQEGCLANVCDLSYPSNYYILPIPDSSTDLNENIEQNEGY